MNVVESTAEYWSDFNEKVGEIQVLLDHDSVTPEHLLDIKSKISSLQTFATSNLEILPKYDVRRSQEEIDFLKKKTQTLEEKFQPRKKFAFSSKSKTKQEKSNPLPASAIVSAPKESSVEQTIQRAEGCVTIENRNNETMDVMEIISFSEASHDHIQLLARSCQNCRIYLTGSLGSARFESLSNCQVFLGPCATSVYLESCTNCIFFVWCHQLRIHTTTTSDLYVFVNSHPIIEDCTLLRFAPYLLEYDGLRGDITKTRLETSRNWSNVVDFRWHRSTPSPNWVVLPVVERIANINIEGLRISTIQNADTELEATVQSAAVGEDAPH